MRGEGECSATGAARTLMESWELAEMVPERLHSHRAASLVWHRAAPAVLEMCF